MKNLTQHDRRPRCSRATTRRESALIGPPPRPQPSCGRGRGRRARPGGALGRRVTLDRDLGPVIVTVVVVADRRRRTAAPARASYDAGAAHLDDRRGGRVGAVVPRAALGDAARGRTGAGRACTCVVGAVVVFGLASHARDQHPRSVTAVSPRTGGVPCGAVWTATRSVLVWSPVLLLGPLLDLHGTPGSPDFQLTLIVVIAAARARRRGGGGARRSTTPRIRRPVDDVRRDVRRATLHSSQWLPTWILLANAVPAVIRGRRLLVAVPLVAAVLDVGGLGRRAAPGEPDVGRGLRRPARRRRQLGVRRTARHRGRAAAHPRRSSPASRSPRSASASPATCTTCSATRCR